MLRILGSGFEDRLGGAMLHSVWCMGTPSPPHNRAPQFLKLGVLNMVPTVLRASGRP